MAEAFEPALLLKANLNGARFLTENKCRGNGTVPSIGKHSLAARNDNRLVAGQIAENSASDLRFYCDEPSYDGRCYCGRPHLTVAA